MCGISVFRYSCGHVWKGVTEYCTLKSESLPLREVAKEICRPCVSRDDRGVLLKGHCGSEACAKQSQPEWRYNDVKYEVLESVDELKARDRKISSLQVNTRKMTEVVVVRERLDMSRTRTSPELTSFSKGVKSLKATPHPTKKDGIRKKKLRSCAGIFKMPWA